MDVNDILDSAQFIVNQEGQKTAALLDISSWKAVKQLLEDIAKEDELRPEYDLAKLKIRRVGEGRKKPELLKKIMDEMSEQAEENGLTPETLQTFLDEEDEFQT